jgi:hypothetical protein
VTDSEMTTTILREIRDSIRTLDHNVTTRIDKLDERLTGRIDTLTGRVETIEHTLKDVGVQLVLITRYLKNKTEVEVEDLKVRVSRLESKVG